MAMFLVAAVAIVSLVVVLGVVLYRREQARIASILGLCASKGWQFSKFDPFGLAARWDGPPFGSGYARKVQNVVTGVHEGLPLVAFDYSYKERSGNNRSQSTTYRYVVVALGMPCALPALHLTPEGMLSRLGDLLGVAEDIELESEDFNRRYCVRCPDKKLAMDVLTPRTMEFLLGNDTVALRFCGADALSYDGGQMEPYAILRAAHVLAGVIRGVPSFVWEDHGAKRSSA